MIVFSPLAESHLFLWSIRCVLVKSLSICINVSIKSNCAWQFSIQWFLLSLSSGRSENVLFFFCKVSLLMYDFNLKIKIHKVQSNKITSVSERCTLIKMMHEKCLSFLLASILNPPELIETVEWMEPSMAKLYGLDSVEYANRFFYCACVFFFLSTFFLVVVMVFIWIRNTCLFHQNNTFNISFCAYNPG